jgi:hypothetical protein
MIRSHVLGCTVPLLMIAAPALADQASAESCARSLSPAAFEIYRAAAPSMRPNADMAAILRAKVMPMVMSGDMNRTTARIAATAASFCLRNLQQPQTTEIAARTP